MRKISGTAASPFWPMLAAVSGVVGPAVPAFAQIEDQGFRKVQEAPEGYEPRTLRAGRVIISPELDLAGYYDSNIYADESGEVDDFVITAVPRIYLELDNERLKWTAQGFAGLRRHVDNSTENSTTFGARSDVVARPSEQLRLGAGARFVRASEDRGEPEGRTATGIGPRRFDELGGELMVHLQGSRLGIQLRGDVEKLDFLSAADAERDHSNYRGTVRALYRLSGLLFLFAQGDVNHRDYRLGADITGTDRDSITYSGNLGVQIDPGGKLRGEAQVGLFRYDPDDPMRKKHTGFELGAGLTYDLTPRTIITLTAFRGDVATVRAGASGRTDTRARLGVQQEIRHNLRLGAGVGWRQADYRGISGEDQDKFAADAEVEYLMNRHIALALVGRYNGRQSEAQGEDYNRFQAGLALRLKY